MPWREQAARFWADSHMAILVPVIVAGILFVSGRIWRWITAVCRNSERLDSLEVNVSEIKASVDEIHSHLIKKALDD